MRTDYFVYLHRRATTGKVFYVGKGTRYRYASKWNRSQHWHNIVNKHGYTIEIVQAGMQEWWAFEMERELILKYQDHELCNRTDGGEGTSGYRLTDEQKEKQRRVFEEKQSGKSISQKAKERFKDPVYLEKHKQNQREIMQRPEVKQKLRQAAIAQFASPIARELNRQKTKAQFANPAARHLAKIKALARFDTPDKRAKHAQAKALMCINNSMIFGSTTLAAEWVTSWRGKKADNSQIAKACRGQIRAAYNLQWKYVTPTTEVSAES